MNSKKQLLDKQKELKAKYTMVGKKTDKNNEKVVRLDKSPEEINWKQAEDAIAKVHFPV